VWYPINWCTDIILAFASSSLVGVPCFMPVHSQATLFWKTWRVGQKGKISQQVYLVGGRVCPNQLIWSLEHIRFPKFGRGAGVTSGWDNVPTSGLFILWWLPLFWKSHCFLIFYSKLKRFEHILQSWKYPRLCFKLMRMYLLNIPDKNSETIGIEFDISIVQGLTI
jgi:hypothetical protein